MRSMANATLRYQEFRRKKEGVQESEGRIKLPNNNGQRTTDNGQRTNPIKTSGRKIE